MRWHKDEKYPISTHPRPTIPSDEQSNISGVLSDMSTAEIHDVLSEFQVRPHFGIKSRPVRRPRPQRPCPRPDPTPARALRRLYVATLITPGHCSCRTRSWPKPFSIKR